MQRKFSNAVFDLGGVVLDWNPDAVLAGFAAHPEERGALRASLFGHPDWHHFDRGTLSEPQLIERLEARTQRSKTQLSAIVDAVRESLVTKPDTVELMNSLHARGIKLYCLSNMPMSVYEHVRRRHDFWDVFHGIVISGDVQLMKPEPAVFRHLLQKYGLRAEESVFIDDLAANVAGAKSVGLQGVVFEDAVQCRRELGLLFGHE